MLIALVLACSGGDAPAPAPSGPPELRAGAGGTPLDDHMKEHYRDATLAMEAWVGANFESAATHLNYLAEHPAAKGLPESAAPYVETMQGAARRAAEPSPPAETARAFADLGAACGACHAELGVKPTIQLSDPPPESKDVQPHMIGHLWAVRAMWIGLVTNDDHAWARGANHLSGDPLHGEAFGVGDLPENLVAHTQTVHENGRLAANSVTVAEKTAAFTSIVGACGDCHLEMRGE